MWSPAFQLRRALRRPARTRDLRFAPERARVLRWPGAGRIGEFVPFRRARHTAGPDGRGRVGVADRCRRRSGPVTGPGRLVVARHGQTEWSRSGRHTGRTDVPLVPDGEDQARALGERLRGAGFAAVRTSPLARARTTCALAGFGERAEVDPDLAEWDYGDYEGLTTPEIQAERPGWLLWFDGVAHGESIDDVAARADRVVAWARAQVGDTLVFAHGHVLRVLAARWLGLVPVAGRLFALGPGALGVLGWEHDEPAMLRWNVTDDPLL